MSFSSPLLRAVLRLERGCFLSGLPSAGAALSGFTGWGLWRQTEMHYGEEKAGPQFCWTETHHCFLWWLPLHSKASGQLCPTFLSTRPPAPPHFTASGGPAPSPGEQRPLRLLCARTQSARAAPSTHLPSILFCIVTFLWLGERSVASPPRFPVFSGLWGSPGGGTGRAKTRKELGKPGHWAAHVPPLVLPLSIYTGLCLPGYHPQSPHLFLLTQPLQSL